MKNVIIFFFVAFCLTKANAQQSNERQQRENQIATKEINSQKVTTVFENFKEIENIENQVAATEVFY